MDLRSAIRNLVTTVSSFITDPKLKNQLDQLYSLTIRPESNLEEIQQMMFSLGKTNASHHRIISSPVVLPSPKQQSKVSTTSNITIPISTTNGIKLIAQGSRIEYVSPFKSARDNDKGSSGSIKLKNDKNSLTTLNININEFKAQDKLKTEIPQKLKLKTELPQESKPVPLIQDIQELKVNEKKNLLLAEPTIIKQNNNLKLNIEQIKVKQQYDEKKNTGRLLKTINQCIDLFRNNTFKLRQIIEKTSEIETCSSLLHNSQLESSQINVQRKSQNPLFKGIHEKMSDQDLYIIQQNFLMKKLIVRAKPFEHIESTTTQSNIHIKQF